MGQHCHPGHTAGLGDCTEGGWDSLESCCWVVVLPSTGRYLLLPLLWLPPALPHTVPQSSSFLLFPAPNPHLHTHPPHPPTCQTCPSSARLTHGGCGQCLSPHNLGWSQAIQKVTELAFSSKPCGKNKPAEGHRGHVRKQMGWGGGRCRGLSCGVLGLSFSSVQSTCIILSGSEHLSFLHTEEKYTLGCAFQTVPLCTSG